MHSAYLLSVTQVNVNTITVKTQVFPFNKGYPYTTPPQSLFASTGDVEDWSESHMIKYTPCKRVT